MTCTPCKTNPGERRMDEPLNMQAGRVAAHLRANAYRPTMDQLEVLSIVADVYESDPENIDDAAKIFTGSPEFHYGEHTPENYRNNLLTGAWFHEWSHARTLLFHPTLKMGMGPKNGMLWYYTSLIDANGQNDVGRFLRVMSAYTLRDAVLGMDGIRLVQQPAPRFKSDRLREKAFHEFALGLAMEVFEMDSLRAGAVDRGHLARRTPRRNPPGDHGPYYIMTVNHARSMAQADGEFSESWTSDLHEQFLVAIDALATKNDNEAFKIMDAFPQRTIRAAWHKFMVDYRMGMGLPSQDKGWGMLRVADDHDSFEIGFWLGQDMRWLEQRRLPMDAANEMNIVEDIVEASVPSSPKARRNPVDAPPSASDAVNLYQVFWKMDPKDIGEFHPEFTIPAQVALVGDAEWITYQSGKTDPETLQVPKDPVNYIHDFDDGVQLFAPGAGVAVPSFVREAKALTLLGICLGWQVETDQGTREAEATKPMPELYAIPSGNALLVIQDKREVLAIFWGGKLTVEGRGIVH